MPLTRRARIAALGGGVAVYLAAIAGAVAAGAAVGSAPASVPRTAATVTPSPTLSPTPEPEMRAVPAAPAAPARVRTCSVAAEAADPRLASFQGHVLNAATGEVLFDRGGDVASRTASVLKVLTSAAALSVLGPDHRLSTTVVRGAEPGTVVLIGGGDPTLSRTPSGSESVYPGAAHLDDLAAQVRAAWDADPVTAGTRITTVVLDSSYFGGEDWHASWKRSELTQGYMPEITALMVDGDRDDPYATTSRRSEDPVQRAGDAFASLLGATTVRGAAPPDAPVLGRVQSQPVSALVQQTLIVSDNAIAEALARVTAIEAGAGNTFASHQAGITRGLAAYGLDTSALRIVDGSGLSGENAVPPAYLTALFTKVLNKEAALWAVYDGLPVSGRTGSLRYADRFAGAASRADGAVLAKTGWIDDGYTLSGIVYAADGTPLTFAIYALGNVRDDAKQAIDALTAAIWDCGDDLSNY